MILQDDVYTTKRKALRINLDLKIFGTLAEIGGGQEVARAFFQAGGASGTIAKSISAYDKTFSDRFYNDNKKGRHVSEDRLRKMLKKEHSELISVLSEKKERDTRFFAFADTVETINFNKTNQGHGWLGVRFQLTPYTEANEVIIHVKLKENDALLQQYTLGTLGVNLIFACFNYYNYPNKFLTSLLDNLDTHRVEIDNVQMTGPELDYIDNRLLSVQLVKNGMTRAIIFDSESCIRQASEMFYKKNILAFRGSFRPITVTGMDILKTSLNLFEKDNSFNKENTVTVCEITLKNLITEGEFDERDFLDRIDLLNGLGLNVLISNYKEYYKLADYFNEFKIIKLRLIMGIPSLKNILDKKYYNDLNGGILEAFGKLFKKTTKLYVYPCKNKESKIETSETIAVENEISSLYNYLKENRKIIDLENTNEKYLGIYSKSVQNKIAKGDKTWEQDVPEFVAQEIKKKRLYGFS